MAGGERLLVCAGFFVGEPEGRAVGTFASISARRYAACVGLPDPMGTWVYLAEAEGRESVATPNLHGKCRHAHLWVDF